MVRIIYFIVFIIPTLGFSQTNSINIEHLGPQDTPLPAMFIIKDSTLADTFVQNHQDQISIVTLTSIENYLKLDSLFQFELRDSIGNGGIAIWANMRITSYDENFNVLYKRYICCNQDTADTFRRLISIRGVGDNEFLCRFFERFVYFIELDLK
jgi:hypothetical protein